MVAEKMLCNRYVYIKPETTINLLQFLAPNCNNKLLLHTLTHLSFTYINFRLQLPTPQQFAKHLTTTKTKNQTQTDNKTNKNLFTTPAPD